MAVFDDYIEQVKQYIKDMRGKDVPIKEMMCMDTLEKITKELPLRIGSGANRGIILRGETFIELGNPLEGSSSIFLWTDDTSKITNGKITLFGQDIPEASGASIPFGQIFMVAGKKLPDMEHNELVHNQRVSNEIEGFMLKSSPDYDSWGRVSKDAAQKGFCFEILGKAMMALYRSKVPDAEAIEIVFITTKKDDLKQLEQIASKAKEISREIVRESWKAKGYDLDCNYDCSSCGDRNVCDDIRDVVKKQAERLKRKYVKRTSKTESE